jgi:hypothetical protein
MFHEMPCEERMHMLKTKSSACRIETGVLQTEYSENDNVKFHRILICRINMMGELVACIRKTTIGVDYADLQLSSLRS